MCRITYFYVLKVRNLLYQHQNTKIVHRVIKMELKQLQYFLAVAETLNFSRASESLYISQPALSYQIAELERELGVELFVRDRRKVFLTPEGQALLEPATDLLRRAKQLPQLAHQRAPEPGGRLRIGFDSTEDHFELTGITQAVADLSLAHPGIRLNLSKLPFTECADRLIYDDLDVAFLILRHRENLPPDLVRRPVYRSRIVMVVRADSPVQTFEEAVRFHELLLVEEKPRGTSRILKILEDMKLEPSVRWVDSLTSGFVYAQMGVGIMLLSETYFKHHHYAGLRALQVDSEAAWITHEAVWNRGNQNPNVKRLLDLLPEV
jgi:DNA-binding transcriptional LysR family regulator